MYLAAQENVEIIRPEIVIFQTIPAHLREMALVMRTEDEEEVIAFGLSPEKALWRAYKGSIMRKTAYVDGKIAAVWGVGGELMGTVGTPWLLTSDQVHKVSPLKFARIYQQEVGEMLKLYPRLVNYVGANYSAAIRLLDIIGFEIGESVKLGPKKNLYRKFEMEVYE